MNEHNQAPSDNSAAVGELLPVDQEQWSVQSAPGAGPIVAQDAPDGDRVFELAAELFSVLATPMRLRILSALCNCEKSVSQLLKEIDTTQPNLSQHLNVLYRCGVLAKRKLGTQVIYRVQSEQAVTLCRSVCTQIAIDMDEPQHGGGAQRLATKRMG
jgi:DNA-binding transcriptional ArsR family regulator